MAPKAYSWLAPSNNATSKAIAAPIRSSQPGWKPPPTPIDLTGNKEPAPDVLVAAESSKKRSHRADDNESNTIIKKRKATQPKDLRERKEPKAIQPRPKSRPIKKQPTINFQLTPPKSPVRNPGRNYTSHSSVNQHSNTYTEPFSTCAIPIANPLLVSNGSSDEATNSENNFTTCSSERDKTLASFKQSMPGVEGNVKEADERLSSSNAPSHFSSMDSEIPTMFQKHDKNSELYSIVSGNNKIVQVLANIGINQNTLPQEQMFGKRNNMTLPQASPSLAFTTSALQQYAAVQPDSFDFQSPTTQNRIMGIFRSRLQEQPNSECASAQVRQNLIASCTKHVLTQIANEHRQFEQSIAQQAELLEEYANALRGKREIESKKTQAIANQIGCGQVGVSKEKLLALQEKFKTHQENGNRRREIFEEEERQKHDRQIKQLRIDAQRRRHAFEARELETQAQEAKILLEGVLQGVEKSENGGRQPPFQPAICTQPARAHIQQTDGDLQGKIDNAGRDRMPSAQRIISHNQIDLLRAQFLKHTPVSTITPREIVKPKAGLLQIQASLAQDTQNHTDSTSRNQTSATPISTTQSADHEIVPEKECGSDIEDLLEDFFWDKGDDIDLEFAACLAAADAVANSRPDFMIQTETRPIVPAPQHHSTVENPLKRKYQEADDSPHSRQNAQAHTTSQLQPELKTTNSDSSSSNETSNPPTKPTPEFSLPFEIEEFDFSEPDQYTPDWFIKCYGTANPLDQNPNAYSDSPDGNPQPQPDLDPDPESKSLPNKQKTMEEWVSDMKYEARKEQAKRYNVNKGAKDWSGRSVPLGH